jgi:hypothetical protein
LAVLLLAYYVNYSYRECKELFSRIFDDRTCEAIIKQLLKSFEEQEKLLTITRISLDESIPDIIESILRNPYNMMFDCDQLCLQLFAIFSEHELFTKYIFDALPDTLITKALL